MKKILGLAGAIIVICASSYYVTGVFSQRAFERVLKDIHQTKGVDIKLLDYKRGWLSSQAQLELDLHVPESQPVISNGVSSTIKAMDYNFKIPVSLHHGPLMLTQKGWKIGLGFAEVDLPIIPEEYRKQISKLLDSASTYPRIQTYLHLSFLSSAHLCTEIPSFKWVTQAHDASFEFFGMRTNSNFALDLQSMNGELSISGAKFDKKDVVFAFNQIHGQYNLAKTPLNLLVGSIKLSLDSLNMVRMGKTELLVKNLVAATSTSQSQDLFNSSLLLDLDRLVLDGQDYGPGKLDLSFNQLDAKVLANIRQQWQTISSTSLIGRQKILLGLLPEIPKLLANNPKLEIAEFSFKVPEGNITGRAMLNIPASNSNNPFQMLTHMKGNGHFQLPKQLLLAIFQDALSKKLDESPAAVVMDSSNIPQAQEIQALVDKKIGVLLTTGVLVQQDKDLIIDWTLDQGRLQINGKPFTPSMFDF